MFFGLGWLTGLAALSCLLAAGAEAGGLYKCGRDDARLVF